MSFGMVLWMWVCCAQFPLRCSTVVFNHFEPGRDGSGFLSVCTRVLQVLVPRPHDGCFTLAERVSVSSCPSVP